MDIYTPRGSERLRAGRTMLVRGTPDDPEFQITAAIPRDDWDQWNESRDRDLEHSASYRYVSPSIAGAEDLDNYGDWVYDAPYGYVWAPRVAVDWAPYRYGRWSWIDYYGWNWVSYDPWGWAPYHYGRWYQGPRGWCWWPRRSAPAPGTRTAILDLKGEDELLAHDLRLRQSIRLRNPYVDPISLLQVDLLARWRATNRSDDDLLHALIATVNGIAAGIQNTG